MTQMSQQRWTLWIIMINERMNEWMNEWMNKWMNKQTNEWMNNEWMNEWMNESHIFGFVFVLCIILTTQYNTTVSINCIYKRVPHSITELYLYQNVFIWLNIQN